MQVKGQKGQIEDFSGAIKVENENDSIGFKCLHYSVTESAGSVTLTLLKKEKALNQEITIGIRTIEGSAVGGNNFQPVDDIITIKKKDNELPIKIDIIDNHDW